MAIFSIIKFFSVFFSSIFFSFRFFLFYSKKNLPGSIWRRILFCQCNRSIDAPPAELGATSADENVFTGCSCSCHCKAHLRFFHSQTGDLQTPWQHNEPSRKSKCRLEGRNKEAPEVVARPIGRSARRLSVTAKAAIRTVKYDIIKFPQLGFLLSSQHIVNPAHDW